MLLQEELNKYRTFGGGKKPHLFVKEGLLSLLLNRHRFLHTNLSGIFPFLAGMRDAVCDVYMVLRPNTETLVLLS